MQITAEIACRSLGFVTGILQNAKMAAPLRPSWLSDVHCAGPEEEIAACARSVYGDTASCGDIQRLFCITDRMP